MPKKVKTVALPYREEMSREEYVKTVRFLRPEIERVRAVFAEGRGWQGAWGSEYSALRDKLIIQMMADGQSRDYIRNIFITEGGAGSTQTVDNWIKHACDAAFQLREKDLEKVRTMQILRIEEVYRRAMQRDNLDTALKALEQLAKTQGLYSDTNVVNMPVLQFHFGDEQPAVDMIMDAKEIVKDE